MDDVPDTRGNNDSMHASTPAYLLQQPPIQDELSTFTSQVQDKTIRECLPLLKGLMDPSRSPFDFDLDGMPFLDRELHADFVRQNLSGFPAQFVAIDASRPWFIYWALTSLYLLGEQTLEYRDRVVKSFHSLQNESGGFGGGHGHASHLAPTYAVLLSLAMMQDEGAYSLVNRTQMWNWLGRLKLPNGGFLVCESGEEDVRGSYCAMVALSLLDLPWDLPQDSPGRAGGHKTFGDGLGHYLSRCQTYEGGLAAAPGLEAHGAYTFCALACLSLLDAPHRSMREFLDLDGVLRWLSARQYAPEGGLAGRTNKLVDGCYSHWIGGCWPLVEAAINGPCKVNDNKVDISEGLFNREALARYILACAQSPNGGLRDKPSANPDLYHTCYNLVGLSVTDHFSSYMEPEPDMRFSTTLTWFSGGKKATVQLTESHEPVKEVRTRPLHPVFVIPHDAVVSMRLWHQTSVSC